MYYSWFKSLSGTLPRSLSQLNNIKTLQLQCNYFIGSLNGIIDPKNQIYLQNFDISDNSFTGSLPVELFDLPSIQTIAAVKNCFSGYLPDNICKPKTLNVLALDGLTSSPKCISYIASFLNGYISSPMKGTIPTCLYSLPNITTLHMSGNSFSGSISNIQMESLSPFLDDLTLSFNRYSHVLGVL